MHISGNGLRLIEGFEGWSSCPYWDSYGGVWTRGFGETEGIGPRSACISHDFGERNLRYRIERFYEWALRDLRVDLNQNQWDALCSFVWNLGAGIFQGSTLGRLLRERRWHEAGDAMLAYDHAGGVVLEGLRRRRVAERALFLSGAPALSNPLSLLMPNERKSVEAFDRLKSQRWRHPVNYGHARQAIINFRKAIWNAAERGLIPGRPPQRVQRGWNVLHRAERYNILRSRVR